MGEPLPHGGFLRGLAVQGLGGVLGKGGVEGVRVLGLEENQVAAIGGILFQRKVHTVFFGNVFKGLDILIGDLDILNTLPLLHKLLYSLFAVVDFRILGLRHVLSHSPFEKIGGHFAASLANFDCQGDGFIPYFVLHDDIPPSMQAAADNISGPRRPWYAPARAAAGELPACWL